jgi:aspartyl-tRNA(Asn)/glutamyl-tRNA(Gln) amidotransferase subunit C
MKIDIQHLARLAHLRIEADETEQFARQMDHILDIIDRLPAIEGEAEGLDPSNPMLLRDDTPVASPPREEILANAPQVEAGCVVVPRIVE